MVNVGHAVVGGALAAAVVTWAAAKQLTINRGAVVVKIVAAAGSMQMIKVATSTAGGLAVVASATAICVTRHWVIRGAAAVGVTSVEAVTVVTSVIWPTAMVAAKNKMNVSGQAGRGCVMVETVVV